MHVEVSLVTVGAAFIPETYKSAETRCAANGESRLEIGIIHTCLASHRLDGNVIWAMAETRTDVPRDRTSGSMRSIFGGFMKRLLKQPDRRFRLDIDGYRAHRSSEAARFVDPCRRRPRFILAWGKRPGTGCRRPAQSGCSHRHAFHKGHPAKKVHDQRKIRWSPSERVKPLIQQLPAS